MPLGVQSVSCLRTAPQACAALWFAQHARHVRLVECAQAVALSRHVLHPLGHSLRYLPRLPRHGRDPQRQPSPRRALPSGLPTLAPPSIICTPKGEGSLGAKCYSALGGRMLYMAVPPCTLWAAWITLHRCPSAPWGSPHFLLP